MPYKPNLASPDAPKITRDQMSDSEFTYPGKLVANHKTVTDDEFNKSHNLENGVLKWEQVIEQCHKVWSDGNPVCQYNSLFLQAFDGRPIWKGSDADQLAEAYEIATGGDNDLMPDTTGSKEYVGHYFMFKSVKVPDTEKIYRQIPVEYLGPDYEYKGSVTTIDGGSDGASPEEPIAEDPGAVQQVVETLAGMAADDVRKGAMLDIVKQESGPFANVRTVLGVSLRGGFVPPRAILLDKLVNEGFVTIEDGVIQATVAADDPSEVPFE